jgi:hypothetical protein
MSSEIAQSVTSEVVVIDKDEKIFLTQTSCMNCDNQKCEGCSELLLRKQGLISGNRVHCFCHGHGHNHEFMDSLKN